MDKQGIVSLVDDRELAHLQQWQGRTEQRMDTLNPVHVMALAATLNHTEKVVAGDPLPWLWHWMFFQPAVRQSELGRDGHPSRGGFLPPVPLPRRMWAGGRLAWQADNPLRVGQEIEKTSTIQSVAHKSGRSGELFFVQVEHRYENKDGLALREVQDIVYRAAATPGVAPPPPRQPELAGQAVWSRQIVPDPVLLFRYSALTFNGHRIHYDRPYAMHEEGYPGLVVHGPLIATLLLDQLRGRQRDARLGHFSFRAVRPVFDMHPFSVNGQPQDDGRAIALWAEDHQGWLAMDATATLA